MGRYMLTNPHLGTVLVGEVSIETDPRVTPITGVHVTRGVAPLGGTEELPVRR